MYRLYAIRVQKTKQSEKTINQRRKSVNKAKQKQKKFISFYSNENETKDKLLLYSNKVLTNFWRVLYVISYMFHVGVPFHEKITLDDL